MGSSRENPFVDGIYLPAQSTAVWLIASGYEPFLFSIVACGRSFLMSSAAELEAEAKYLRHREFLLKKQVRELEKKSSITSSKPIPTQWMQAVAIRLFVLSGFDAPVPLEYIRTKSRHADETDVRGWYAGVSGPDREGLLQDGEVRSRSARQLAEARKFFGERSLAHWVQHQNRKKSIAPSPGAVVEHFPALLAGAGKPLRSQRRRLRRIMSRWGGRKGKFSCGSQLSCDALKDKARPH